MDNEDGSALGRWSRLKRRHATQTPVHCADTQSEPILTTGAAAEKIAADRSPDEIEPAATPEPRPAPQADLPDLPDPETLDRDADFTPYLANGVPDALKRRALRVLWRSDPVLANLDGLNDYDEDFSAVGIAKRVIETAWRVGDGYAKGQNGEAPLTSTEDPEASAGADPNGSASASEVGTRDEAATADASKGLTSDGGSDNQLSGEEYLGDVSPFKIG